MPSSLDGDSAGGVKSSWVASGFHYERATGVVPSNSSVALERTTSA
jgi:hypothetical protein